MMGKIHVLDESLVSLISAGEVIENPASIVKELIENSLDAGATHIDIQIEGGGIDSLSVSDNGEGIEKEDCLVCTLRHSTSKISKREDIDSIFTYGFRGEALASIAAVADLEIVTRFEKEEIGTKIQSRAGQIPDVSDASRAQGTKVEVRELFKNVPARKKHLSYPRVESQRVLETVMKHAIIRHDIGFRYIRDGTLVLDCPSNQTPQERVLALWGLDVANSLIEVSDQKAGITVQGFITDTSVSRGNRSRQFFSVRKRPIEDKRLSKTLETAYSSLLMKGRYPMCALDIDMDIEKVDANVHPTKREVRIQDFEDVRNVLRDILTAVLKDTPPMEVPETLEGVVDEEALEPTEFHVSSARSDGRALLLEETPLVKPVPSGQVNMVYIVAATEEGLVLVDQHAAHERILYEQLRNQVNDGDVVVQELLEPLVLKLGVGEAEKILALDETLETMGFTVGSFGGSEVLVSTIPEILGKRVSEDELIVFVDRILDIGEKDAVDQFMDELLKVTACHSAIRSGQKIGHEEAKRLIANLFETDGKYHCAHGRPSIVKISKKELDERFGRTGADALARFRARHRLG
jgi:DNA mismatch repair protein MutL